MSTPRSAEVTTTLQQDVLTALEGLRTALSNYKSQTRQPPTFIHEKTAPKLPANALAGTRVFPDRYSMMLALARGPVGAEVGVQQGNFSRFLLDGLDLRTFHLFDMPNAPIRKDVKNAPQVTFHGGDSSTQLAMLPDHCFDWIYIDGDHSYDGVRKDALVALEKVRSGGLLFFNDYTPWSPGEAIPYGVIALVNELICDRGLQMSAIALAPHGHFDVAVTAP